MKKYTTRCQHFGRTALALWTVPSFAALALGLLPALAVLSDHADVNAWDRVAVLPLWQMPPMDAPLLAWHAAFWAAALAHAILLWLTQRQGVHGCFLGLLLTLMLLQWSGCMSDLCHLHQWAGTGFQPLQATLMLVTGALLLCLSKTFGLPRVEADAGRDRGRQAGALCFRWGTASVLIAFLIALVAHLGWMSRWTWVPLASLWAMLAGVALLSLALGQRSRALRRARHQMEVQSLRMAIEQAAVQRATQDRARLLLAVSHDLREPLYALTLVAECMSRQRASRQLQALVAQMKSALASADGLVDDMHMVANLGAGVVQPRFSDFSVQGLLERIDAQYGPELRRRGLRWTVTPCMARVHSDALLLERMICHLLDNALRLTGRGGVILGCRPRTDHLLIQVWDSGEQMGGPSVASNPDAGVGHALAQHIARLLGIHLSLRSRPGRGHCCSMRIPREGCA